MLKMEVIGNLGADCEIKNKNGKDFITFRIANTEKWTDTTTGEIREITTWISCVKDGRNERLTQYLRKGQKVYVRGTPSFNIYSSPKSQSMEVGVNISVREVELCGASPQGQSTQTQQVNPNAASNHKRSK